MMGKNCGKFVSHNISFEKILDKPAGLVIAADSENQDFKKILMKNSKYEEKSEDENQGIYMQKQFPGVIFSGKFGNNSTEYISESLISLTINTIFLTFVSLGVIFLKLTFFFLGL